MPSFGRTSLKRLSLAHDDLQAVCYESIKIYDFTILETYRSKERQEKLFSQGVTKVHWPNSKHNNKPSLAIDIAPWYKDKPHIRWPRTTKQLISISKSLFGEEFKALLSKNQKELAQFYILATVMRMSAYKLGINLRSGFDWDGDWDLNDQNFDDLPHHELLK